MITATLRWAHAKKRYWAGITSDIGHRQAVTQTGAVSASRSPLDGAYHPHFLFFHIIFLFSQNDTLI
jgi:hypothetical protein